MEKVICSAIWYDDGNIYPHQPKGIETGYVACGLRHCGIIGQSLEDRRQLEVCQGFLTDQNKFVNREDALNIVLNNTQDLRSKREDLKNSKNLYSEDLY